MFGKKDREPAVTFSKVMEIDNNMNNKAFEDDGGAAAAYGRQFEKKVKAILYARGEDVSTFRLTGRVNGALVTASPDLANEFFGKLSLGEIKSRKRRDELDLVQVAMGVLLGRNKIGNVSNIAIRIIYGDMKTVEFEGGEILDKDVEKYLNTLIRTTYIIYNDPHSTGNEKVNAGSLFKDTMGYLREWGRGKIALK